MFDYTTRYVVGDHIGVDSTFGSHRVRPIVRNQPAVRPPVSTCRAMDGEEHISAKLSDIGSRTHRNHEYRYHD